MALTNKGFDGTVDEASFAWMMRLGALEGVADLNAWQVVQGTGRQVSVGAHYGHAFACGVTSIDTAAILKSLATPTNGQWYLIVRRIVWATNTVTVEAIPHSTTSTTLPTAPPSTFPGTSFVPGVQFDQKLAWAWVRSTDTSMILFDLRKQPAELRVQELEQHKVDDLDGLAAVSTAAEGRIIHVDEGGANFQAQDGVWVQITPSRFATSADRDTAYAKAAAAYRVAGAVSSVASEPFSRTWSGSVWARGEVVNLQLDTTNSTGRVVTQVGSGRILGNNTALVSEMLTFPVPFTGIPRVIVTAQGSRAVGAWNDAGLNLGALYAAAASKSLTGVQVALSAPGATLANTVEWYYDWIAIGPVD